MVSLCAVVFPVSWWSADHTGCYKVEGLGSLIVHQSCALRLGIVRQAEHARTFCHATQCHEPKVHSVTEQLRYITQSSCNQLSMPLD